jgi:lysophospholipase L1-like esterase
MFWYEDEVKRLEKRISAGMPQDPYTIFYGSSSIRLWPQVEQQFQPYRIVNLGFGGSTLAACVWFFNRVFGRIGQMPASIVFYAGENDIGDGRHPEEVIVSLLAFLAQLDSVYPGMRLTVVSVKPSPSRAGFHEQIRLFNQWAKDIVAQRPNSRFIDIHNAMLDFRGRLMPAYYEGDGLHMSRAGYSVWNRVFWKNAGWIFGGDETRSPFFAQSGYDEPEDRHQTG